MKQIHTQFIAVLLALALFVACSACVGDGNAASASSTDTSSTDISSIISIEYDEEDLDSGWDSAGMTSITLEGNSITVDGSGATADGTTVTITAAGTYGISGTLTDGQIVVDTEDEETVRLVLNGADITCSTSAPISVANAEKTVITLADGTENSVTDGDSYIFEDAESDEPNAAIFSKDDLTINGGGSLTVTAHYNDGITSKDDLKVTGGSITVNAVNDGIRGKDSVAVRDANLTITVDGDGIQSNNDEDPEKGYIVIESGTIDITAGADGIQAETSLNISGGDITVSSGGGSVNSSSAGGNTWGRWGGETNVASEDTSSSAKGLKAGVAVTITGGTIVIDSSDDAVHANDGITIGGGTIHIASGDDGVHADATLEINGGEIVITKCYEGIESASITINDGTLHITASDDGINVAGGNDGSSMNGRPGQNTFASSGTNALHINGGYIVIDAAGDGIDVNGSVEMTGGTVIVNGPTNSGNGALDYDGGFTVTGGLLVAAGSSGMAQAPGTASTQHSGVVTYASAQQAGTMVHIETESGEDVLTFVPTKAYQSVVLCSPELSEGSTYSVYSGGNSTGTATDGLYSGGTYTPGTQVTEFTVSGIVTYAGSSGAGMPGTGPGGGGAPGGMPR